MPVGSLRVCARRIARYALGMRYAFSPMTAGRAAHVSPVSRRAAMMGTTRVNPSESSRPLPRAIQSPAPQIVT